MGPLPSRGEEITVQLLSLPPKPEELIATLQKMAGVNSVTLEGRVLRCNCSSRNDASAITVLLCAQGLYDTPRWQDPARSERK